MGHSSSKSRIVTNFSETTLPRKPFRLIKSTAILDWSTFTMYQDLKSEDYQQCCAEEIQSKVIFVSHRWKEQFNPDPSGAQLHELKKRIRQFADDFLIFYDYCSLPQKTQNQDRSKEDAELFKAGIMSLNQLMKNSTKCIILSDDYSDYKMRAWCFYELLLATMCDTIEYFDDQDKIKEELEYFRIKFGVKKLKDGTTLKFVNSTHFGVKDDASIQDSILVSIIHLSNCFVANGGDLSLIRSGLLRMFEENEYAPGYVESLLLAALHHFSCRAMVFVNGKKAIHVEPLFDHPDWIPLPSRNEPTVIERLVGNYSEVFSFGINPDDLAGETRPVRMDFFVELVKPDWQSPNQFMTFYRSAQDWKNFIVRPTGDGSVARFPTLDHVMHSMLEVLPPGRLAVTPSSILLRLLPSEW